MLGKALLGDRRGHVHDGAAAFLVHMLEQDLRAPERSLDPDAQHAIDRILAHLFDRLVTQQHGVVDHGVDAAAVLRELRRGGMEGIAIRHVEGEVRRASAAFPDRLDRFRAAGGVDIAGADARAAARQKLRRGAAEAPSGAGDQDRLILQFPVHHSAFSFQFFVSRTT